LTVNTYNVVLNMTLYYFPVDYMMYRISHINQSLTFLLTHDFSMLKTYLFVIRNYFSTQ